jgi:hypothetical protein
MDSVKIARKARDEALNTYVDREKQLTPTMFWESGIEGSAYKSIDDLLDGLCLSHTDKNNPLPVQIERAVQLPSLELNVWYEDGEIKHEVIT